MSSYFLVCLSSSRFHSLSHACKSLGWQRIPLARFSMSSPSVWTRCVDSQWLFLFRQMLHCSARTWPMWMRIASRIASKLSCAEEESEGRFLVCDTRTTKSWATAFRSNDASFFPPLLFQEKNMRPWGTPFHETSANLAYYFVWWFFVNSLSELMLTTISSVISAGCSTLSRAHDTWSWPSDSLEANRFPQIAQHSIHIIERILGASQNWRFSQHRAWGHIFHVIEINYSCPGQCQHLESNLVAWCSLFEFGIHAGAATVSTLIFKAVSS